jgi:2-phosphosulfolactate phosphatase
MMKVNRVNLTNCSDVSGPVVVIDVLRAFTTAAFIFDAGARDITLVSSVEEAFRLKHAHPNLILVGEENTFPIEGFDYGNSPSSFLDKDLHGKHFVQRTTCGTQGVTQATQASHILMSSLCCASATASYISHHDWQSIVLNETGIRSGGRGDEDAACADLIEAILLHKKVDLSEIVRRVRESTIGKMFNDGRPDLPPQDIDLATSIDRFDFAMVVNKEDGLFIARAVYG